jgi:hypothetical protein
VLRYLWPEIPLGEDRGGMQKKNQDRASRLFAHVWLMEARVGIEPEIVTYLLHLQTLAACEIG